MLKKIADALSEYQAALSEAARANVELSLAESRAKEAGARRDRARWALDIALCTDLERP